MSFKTTVTWISTLAAYEENRNISNACEVFAKMLEKTISSYNAMVTAYNKDDCMVDEAYELFCKMSECDAVSYATMIPGYVSKGRLDMEIGIFEGMVRRGVVSLSLMVDGYCKSGRIMEARKLFDEMVERNVVT
ncbi:hypothetical protein V6N13_041627 [Hibiscus sabdariffa]